MSRKVICMKDNKTAPVTQCDADTIMFSTEKCNAEPCEEGMNLARYLYDFYINHTSFSRIFPRIRMSLTCKKQPFQQYSYKIRIYI